MINTPMQNEEWKKLANENILLIHKMNNSIQMSLYFLVASMNIIH